jgi:hypothetical protein
MLALTKIFSLIVICVGSSSVKGIYELFPCFLIYYLDY